MLRHITLPQLVVIGKEGSTDDGPDFVNALWQDANEHFAEIAPLARKNLQGQLVGIWGAMSDMSRSFRPWEDGFTRGLYLAGVNCRDDAEAPEGWTKWVLPASEYVYVPNITENSFANGLELMKEEGLALCGAAYDFTDPITGKMYIYYPIRRL